MRANYLTKKREIRRKKRIKRNNLIIVTLFTVLLSIFAIVLAVVPKGATTASAATNSSAELKTIGRRVNKEGTVIGIGAPEDFYYVTMQSANAFGSGTLDDNALLDWTYVTIKVHVVSGKVKEHVSLVLTKDGIDIDAIKLSGTDSRVLYQGALEDGNYSFLYTASCIFDKYGTAMNYYYRFNFTIDKTAPIYNLKGGDSELQNGGNTANRLVYSVVDRHFQRLYYKSPTASSYSSTTNTSYTVEPISANSGWWYFYAVDTLGQKNETVRVYLDCKAPTMICANGMNFGTTVSEAIKVTAKDEVSTSKLYVKFESEEWFSPGNTYTIPKTERNGRYYFYAEDGNGNRSETYWIVLSTEEPIGSLIKSDSDNSMSFVWNNEYWSATLDGTNYTEGRIIRAEGQHEIILSNNANKTKNYTFKIEHYYKLIGQTATTCFENGVSKYECSQCGDTYEETIYSSGHTYNVVSTPSSCTESEHIVYRCSKCGESYETEGKYPTGHSYVITISKEPTCTEEGIRLNTCEKCGDMYETKIAANGHKYGIAEIQTSKGRTTRIYTCEICGDKYKQELGDQYEEVSNYVEYLFQQYSPYMWWVLLASAGVWSIAIGVMIAIAKKNDEKEKAKKMLVNYVIGLVVIAVIVVACPYLIRGIASLIT